MWFPCFEKEWAGRKEGRGREGMEEGTKARQTLEWRL